MRAVTFQAPHEVRVQERPEPELKAADEAVVSIDASGICGSDLHIFHGRLGMLGRSTTLLTRTSSTIAARR